MYISITLKSPIIAANITFLQCLVKLFNTIIYAKYKIISRITLALANKTSILGYRLLLTQRDILNRSKSSPWTTWTCMYGQLNIHAYIKVTGLNLMSEVSLYITFHVNAYMFFMQDINP